MLGTFVKLSGLLLNEAWGSSLQAATVACQVQSRTSSHCTGLEEGNRGREIDPTAVVKEG